MCLLAHLYLSAIQIVNLTAVVPVKNSSTSPAMGIGLASHSHLPFVQVLERLATLQFLELGELLALSPMGTHSFSCADSVVGVGYSTSSYKETLPLTGRKFFSLMGQSDCFIQIQNFVGLRKSS